MIKRLQELRHTEQVQRAYALNCGEGATVSYEIQIRVLREFGLSDAAAELLQVWGMAVQDHEGGLDCVLCNSTHAGAQVLWNARVTVQVQMPVAFDVCDFINL